MTPQELRKRVFSFAVQVVAFCRSLPASDETREISSQLRRSALATSANYRSAGRARSKKEFIAKLGLVVEEADEASHWLSVLDALQVGDGTTRAELLQEAGELVAIFAASYNTAARQQRVQTSHGRLAR